MTTTQTAMLVCTGVLFISAIIGGLFSVSAANVWLKNKREERTARLLSAELRKNGRIDREREDWMRLLQQKDERIQSLSNELLRVSKNNEFVMKLLKESELQRLGKEQEENACSNE